MKLCPLVIVIAFFTAWAWAGELASPTPKGQVRDSSYLQVEQLAKAPDSLLEKPIAVQGVVAGVNAKRRLFSLIGVKEYAQCRDLNCAGFYFPVRYQGELPKLGATVVAEGKMVKERGKLLFAASKIR